MFSTKLSRNAVLLAAIATVSAFFLASCLYQSGECDTEGVPPLNVTATPRDGSVALSWEIPTYDTLDLSSVQTMVLYAEAGGTGEQCASANINHTPEGCVVGCPSKNSTQCTITGLTNGVTYTFTVLTEAYPHNLYSCTGEAFVRSDPVTPTAL